MLLFFWDKQRFRLQLNFTDITLNSVYFFNNGKFLQRVKYECLFVCLSRVNIFFSNSNLNIWIAKVLDRYEMSIEMLTNGNNNFARFILKCRHSHKNIFMKNCCMNYRQYIPIYFSIAVFLSLSVSLFLLSLIYIVGKFNECVAYWLGRRKWDWCFVSKLQSFSYKIHLERYGDINLYLRRTKENSENETVWT